MELRERKDVVASASAFWWEIILRVHLMVDQKDEGNFVLSRRWKQKSM